MGKITLLEIRKALVNWSATRAQSSTSSGQKAIADYKVNGEQLFFPNADDPNG